MGYGFYQANQLSEMFYWRMFLNDVFLYKYKVFCFFLLSSLLYFMKYSQTAYVRWFCVHGQLQVSE